MKVNVLSPIPALIKGKKGKKGGDEVEIVTTGTIERERNRALCPRLGDLYTLRETCSDINMEVVIYRLEKCVRDSLTEVDLSHCFFDEIPPTLFSAPELSHITSINLSRNNLFSLDGLFEALLPLASSLERLNVSYNHLNGFLPASISSFSNLTTLNLDSEITHNHVLGLCDELGSLSNLESLSLANNSIIDLPPSSLTSLSSLTKLSLRGNKIVEVTSDLIIGLSDLSLSSLLLSSNQIVELPEEIGTLSHLTYLDVSKNNLTALPEALGQCGNLEFLAFSENKITNLPPELFSNLSNLTSLSGYKNKIDIIPPEISNCVSLTTCHLSSNNLKTLPDEIGECSEMRELSLSGNAKFSSIPSSAESWTKLEILNMQKCQGFKQLPTFAENWLELKEIDVRAAKKQVCKMTPDLHDDLVERGCVIRGGVVKGKKKKK